MTLYLISLKDIVPPCLRVKKSKKIEMQWKLFHKKSSFRWSLFFNCYSADCFVYIATKLLFYCWCWETLSFVEGYSRTLIQLQLLLFNNMHAFSVYFLSTEHNEGPEKDFYFQLQDWLNQMILKFSEMLDFKA